MTVSRIVRTSFWKDIDVLDQYTCEDKYFMLYLLTNPQARQVGIYSLPKRIMSFEIGYTIEVINALIKRFEDIHKNIIYNHDTQEVAILNYLKHSIMKGGKPVVDCVRSDLTRVKDVNLIQSVYRHMKNHWELSSREVDRQIQELFLPYFNDNDNDNDNDSIVGVSQATRERIVNVSSTTRNAGQKELNSNDVQMSDKCPDKCTPELERELDLEIETHTERDTRVPATKPALESFDEFWKKYPNKIMQEQSASLWLSIDPDETLIEEIMQGLDRWLASDQWERGIYQSPVNWLRDKRWIDQPPKCKPKKEQAGAHHYEDEELQDLIARKMAKQKAART